MKISAISSSPLLFFCYLLNISLSLAALSIPNPHIVSLNLTNSASGLPPTNADLPNPYQMRVKNTPTTLIFGKYSYPLPPILPFDVAVVVEIAQYEVASSMVSAKGDAPIAQPTFEWRYEMYRTYIRMQQHSVGTMRWETMSQALHGIMQFGWTFNHFVAFEFTVLDDKGVVATGDLGVD